jgi:hypothetical protein
MKDCTTFVKLQEVAISKQAEAKRQGYDRNTNNAPTKINKQTTEHLKVKISQIRDTTMMEDMSHPKGT